MFISSRYGFKMDNKLYCVKKKKLISEFHILGSEKDQF